MTHAGKPMVFRRSFYPKTKKSTPKGVAQKEITPDPATKHFVGSGVISWNSWVQSLGNLAFYGFGLGLPI